MLILLGFTLSCNPETLYYRGNMHTHSLWSDEDEFPESVAAWYKANGYDFLTFTDHNIISEGERWRSLAADSKTLLNYIETYGKEWGEIKADEKEGFSQVRLKSLQEFRGMFEDPGEFLLIMGIEISAPKSDVHLLTFHQEKALPASGAALHERVTMIRKTVAVLDDYKKESGRNTYPALAHPNYKWAITAEMIMEVPELRFFEISNGSTQVNDAGNAYRASTERIWDIVLSNRLKNENGRLLYGLATNDAHHYHGGKYGPDKGWIMVRAKKLEPGSIINSLDKGNFYSSTRVVINKIKFSGNTLKIEIETQEGVDYLTEFIGTRRDFDPSSHPSVDSSGIEIQNTTRKYSDNIGEVLSSSKSIGPSYTFLGDELYVRARITSSADQKDAVNGKILGKQKAWTQPQTISRKIMA